MPKAVSEDLLVILNPRRIEECMSAFAELPIDRLWVRNMTEKRIAERWGDVMEQAAGYRHLVVVSDDGVVRPHALQAVLGLLEAGHPVVTGYSNLSATDFRVNLSMAPIGPQPADHAYTLPTLAQILESTNPVIKTWFAGMCLTGMSYEMWERYPFQVMNEAAQSDFSLCKRLEWDGVPIVAAREAFVWHVKEVWGQGDEDPRKRPVGGDPEIVLERHLGR